MSTKATIVIIEDEKNICSFISRILEPEGYRAVSYTHLTLPTNSRV